MGIAKTIAKFKQFFSFPGMKNRSTEALSHCDLCHRSKSARHKPYGLLQPLETPERPWDSITIDFITKLPASPDPVLPKVKYDGIMTVVDRLKKWAYFLPFEEACDAEQVADVVLRHVISNHGWPKESISDRDLRFASKFWQALMKRLGVESQLSTAYHPQTDE